MIVGTLLAAVVATLSLTASPTDAFQLFNSTAGIAKRSHLDRRQLQSGITFSGSATYYGSSPSDPPPMCAPACGACGPAFIPQNPNYFAALSLNTFSASSPGGNSYANPICGQCAHVFKDGNKVVVPIVDACPGCANYGPTSLDLSQQAFGELVGGYEAAARIGRTTITWTIGPCECGKGAGSNYNCGGNPPQPSPQPSPQPPTGGSCSGSTHRIVSGDLCFQLAARYSISLNTLISLNSNLNCNNLQIGSVLCVGNGGGSPAPSQPPSPAPSQPPQPPTSGTCSKPYTIISGDICFNIAKEAQIDLNTLLSLNAGLQCQNLQIGDVICLSRSGSPAPSPAPSPTPSPSPPTCARTYTIISGDICFNIARNASLDLNTFLSLNPGLNCQNLQIGAEVCLPPLGYQGPAPSPPPPTSGTCPNSYTVQSGDFCFKIAVAAGIDVNGLISLNPGLKCENLQIGAVLCLPRSSLTRGALGGDIIVKGEPLVKSESLVNSVSGTACNKEKEWRKCDDEASGWYLCDAEKGIWKDLTKCSDGKKCFAFGSAKGGLGAYCA